MSWLDLLSESLCDTDVVPENWQSTRQIAAQTNIGDRQVQKRLAKLIDQGAVRVKSFRVKTPTGVRHVPHYSHDPEAS